MKKLIYITILIAIQHLAINIQNSFGQTPFTTPDNLGAGNCLNFDGVNDYTITNPVSNFPSTSFTISFWMNSNDVAGDGFPISYATTGNDNAISIWFTAAGTATLWVNSFQFVTTPTISIRDGNWHHVAVTWTNAGGAINMYTDGNLFYSGTLNNGGVIPGGGSFVMGQDQDLVGGGFQTYQAYLGKMDEVCIWNRVLSQTEIKDRMCKKLTVGSETGLVGYWNMNNATSTSDTNVADLTSNNNDATRTQH